MKLSAKKCTDAWLSLEASDDAIKKADKLKNDLLSDSALANFINNKNLSINEIRSKLNLGYNVTDDEISLMRDSISGSLSLNRRYAYHRLGELEDKLSSKIKIMHDSHVHDNSEFFQNFYNNLSYTEKLFFQYNMNSDAITHNTLDVHKISKVYKPILSDSSSSSSSSGAGKASVTANLGANNSISVTADNTPTSSSPGSELPAQILGKRKRSSDPQEIIKSPKRVRSDSLLEENRSIPDSNAVNTSIPATFTSTPVGPLSRSSSPILRQTMTEDGKFKNLPTSPDSLKNSGNHYLISPKSIKYLGNTNLEILGDISLFFFFSNFCIKYDLYLIFSFLSLSTIFLFIMNLLSNKLIKKYKLEQTSPELAKLLKLRKPISYFSIFFNAFSLIFVLIGYCDLKIKPFINLDFTLPFDLDFTLPLDLSINKILFTLRIILNLAIFFNTLLEILKYKINNNIIASPVSPPALWALGFLFRSSSMVRGSVNNNFPSFGGCSSCGNIRYFLTTPSLLLADQESKEEKDEDKEGYKSNLDYDSDSSDDENIPRRPLNLDEDEDENGDLFFRDESKKKIKESKSDNVLDNQDNNSDTNKKLPQETKDYLSSEAKTNLESKSTATVPEQKKNEKESNKGSDRAEDSLDSKDSGGSGGSREAESSQGLGSSGEKTKNQSSEDSPATVAEQSTGGLGESIPDSNEDNSDDTDNGSDEGILGGFLREVIESLGSCFRFSRSPALARFH